MGKPMEANGKHYGSMRLVEYPTGCLMGRAMETQRDKSPVKYFVGRTMG